MRIYWTDFIVETNHFLKTPGGMRIAKDIYQWQKMPELIAVLLNYLGIKPGEIYFPFSKRDGKSRQGKLYIGDHVYARVRLWIHNKNKLKKYTLYGEVELCKDGKVVTLVTWAHDCINADGDHVRIPRWIVKKIGGLPDTSQFDWLK